MTCPGIAAVALRMLMAAALGACATAPAAAPPAAPDGPSSIDYVFSVDPSLGRIAARVCFGGAAPSGLTCATSGGDAYLTTAQKLGSEQGLLTVSEGRISLAELGHDACLRYEVDVASSSLDLGGLLSARAQDAVLANTALWLWRPPPAERHVPISARFELPPGMDVSVPWPQQAGVYQLDETAFAFRAYAAFGRFERMSLEVPGGRLDVHVIQGFSQATRAVIAPWLQTQARAAALLGGAFPVERAQVLVIPSGTSADSGARFGTVARGGGASVALLVPRDAQLEPLRKDWVAVHEFTHLRHPFVRRGDAWISEGLATYYQEVLRVRAGLHSAEAAWTRLYEGGLQGRASGASLQQESRRMFSTHRFPLVYWGGAAFALRADVELRRASSGQTSLDSVLGELTRCCAVAAGPWSAQAVIERLDAIHGGDLFSRLYRESVADSYPELDGLYRELGLLDANGSLQAGSQAPLSHIREAIMQAPPEH